MIESGYFMNAIIRNIEMVRADTMSFGFQVQGLKGERPEFVQFSCKNTLETEEYLFAVSLDDTIDFRSYDAEKDILTYSVRIPPEKTAPLAEGRYFYDLELRVNGDVITLMIGRLSIIEQVTDYKYNPSPEYENGNNVKYPREDIPLGLLKLYTESVISEIGGGIEAVNDHNGGYTVSEMVSAIGGIKEEVDAINEAVKAKTGETEDYPFSELAEAVESIPQGSADLMELLASASTAVTGNSIVISDETTRTNSLKVPSYMAYRRQVTEVSLANIEEVGIYAFYQDFYLLTINLPKCEIIGESAFYQVPMYAQASDAVNLNIPKVKSIGVSAFQASKIYGVLNIPECTSIDNNAFNGCDKITGIVATMLETIGHSAFRGCSQLTSVNFPSVVSIGAQALRGCTLSDVEIGERCTSIGRSLFDSSTVTNLTIRAVTPPTLDTTLGGTISHIYVPAESVTAYQNASAWSNYSSIIEAITA